MRDEGRDATLWRPVPHSSFLIPLLSARYIGLVDSPSDSHFMRRALALAERGWGQTAPNPLVGAVVVRDGEVVGEGFHERFGEAHAEIVALREAGDRARGATVYVTLEPCAHHGKTPPCADALVAAGVARVVIALRDPNPVAAGGAARLAAAGIETTFGVEERGAAELNAPFVHAFRSPRPWVTLKLALSLDGAIATADGAPCWLTGDESRREVHRLRAGADAVAVGLRTALLDDPLLTVRDWPPPREAPRRVVFDRRALLPPGSRLARTARDVPTIVLAESPDPARAAVLERLGVEVLAAAGLAEGLAALRERGVRSLLVEGGAGLAGAMLDAGVVDRLIIFQAPVILGGGSLNAFGTLAPRAAGRLLRLEVLERREFGPDLKTVYALPAAPCSPD